MADSAVPITAGAGTNIDTRTEATNGQHRQVVVLGDPSVNNDVAPVTAANGLAVDITRMPNEGQQTMANSISVAISSDQSAVPVTFNLPNEGQQTMANSISVAVSSDQTAVPVSLASVPSHNVTNAGTFVSQENGPALTSLQLIDDAVQIEDAVHSSGDKGVLALGVRRDADTTPVSADGDYHALQFDALGNLKVNIKAGAAAGGTSSTDDGAFSVGGQGTPMMGFATADVVDANDVGVLAMTTARGLHVNLRSAAGTEITAGTEYTEGDTDATISGVAMLWEDASDTLRAVSVAKPLPIQTVPGVSNGLSIFRSLDLDETEEDVKTSAGQIYGWFITNLAASTRYLKIYNDTAANVTVGVTTPILTIPLEVDQACVANFPQGLTFGTAICAAATNGIADNDTGAPGVNEVVVNIFYK